MKLGSITIGQSPRNDVIPEMINFLDDDIEIIEVGALDDLSDTDIELLKPEKGDYVLVSKLNNGNYATFSKKSIIPNLIKCVQYLESKNVDIILFLCTGTFDYPFQATVPIIYPDDIFKAILPKIVGNSKLGVLTPEENQIPQTIDKWSNIIKNVKVANLSPYACNPNNILEPNIMDILSNSDILFLDCMGYGQNLKENLKNIKNIPIICSRTFIARILSEYLNII